MYNYIRKLKNIYTVGPVRFPQMDSKKFCKNRKYKNDVKSYKFRQLYVINIQKRISSAKNKIINKIHNKFN